MSSIDGNTSQAEPPSSSEPGVEHYEQAGAVLLVFIVVDTSPHK